MYYYNTSFSCLCKMMILHLHHQIINKAYTAMTNEDYMNEELTSLSTMTDEEICEKYNLDSADEAEIYIREYWTCIA
nr:MAG TPA: hypothetical protein [Caudoviricetes sp.]DAL75397.1 MAG TPA: hypothetical protein [Bacteriophage sp.]